MKFKFGLLAAAAGLVFASASASAAISSAGNGDMVFLAWDLNGTSYARDLGAESNLTTANTTYSVAAGSAFASTFAGDTSAQIKWAVVALDSTDGNIYTTGNTANIINSIVTNGDGVAIDVPQNESAALSGWAALNALGTNSAGEYIGSKNNAPSNPTYPGNIYNLASAGDKAYGGIGASQNFVFEDASNTQTIYQLFTNPALSGTNFGGGANGGYFTLADAQGDVTWTDTASVSAVPLPAAALLFAPGLLGMIGLGRRRNQA